MSGALNAKPRSVGMYDDFGIRRVIDKLGGGGNSVGNAGAQASGTRKGVRAVIVHINIHRDPRSFGVSNWHQFSGYFSICPRISPLLLASVWMFTYICPATRAAA